MLSEIIFHIFQAMHLIRFLSATFQTLLLLLLCAMFLHRHKRWRGITR